MINLVGCGVVTAIAMRRRAQWKRRMDLGRGAGPYLAEAAGKPP
jgi:hypothetical protein